MIFLDAIGVVFEVLAALWLLGVAFDIVGAIVAGVFETLGNIARFIIKGE